MNWLKIVGIEPLFWLTKGGVPVFDRTVVEKHVARAEFVSGAHPRWIKHKLLDMVGRGNSVHQAAISCGVSYPTAKRWAATEAAPDALRGARGSYPHSAKRKLLDMVKRGSSIRQAATNCGVNYVTARRWTNAAA
jgi:transposase